MTDVNHGSVIRTLSDRIVTAQQNIRILDAIAWDDNVRAAFFAKGAKEQPPVDRAYYARRPLRCDPSSLRKEFERIDRDIVSQLGTVSPAGGIMRRMCGEYREVLSMLEARGTPDFSPIAQRLYGRSTDAFHAGGPALVDLAGILDDTLCNIDDNLFLEQDQRSLSTERAVRSLQERLDRVFTAPDSRVHVSASDGIVADAAAGSDYIKLREDVLFSDRDLRVLEVHEGWVHVGTTLNGRAQPYCTFLSKGTPSTTVTQEGLAVFIEVVSFSSHPARLRRVTDRIRGIHMAEEGATFLDVYRRLLEENRDPADAYAATARVFRGSLPTAGPFTKDLAYSKGFIEIYNFMRLAVRRGVLDRIPLFFCGKVRLEDLGVLADLVDQRLVVRPLHLPPPIADLAALTAWMAYSNFLNRLNLDQVEADFTQLLA